MATNPNGMNNSGDASAMTATADCAIDEESGPTHVPASSVVASATETVSSSGSAAESQQPPKSNEEISDFSDTQLKALLDEAMTYKTPKDLAHKSETFKELLKRAETEEQSRESSYAYIPFTSSGGGSLQNIFESVNSEPRKYLSSSGSANPRRHHMSGRHSQSHYHSGIAAGASGAGGGGGGAGVGSGGHQAHHHNSHQQPQGARGSHGGERSYVSSRQGEGGSLPSNVNIRSTEVHPFIVEMQVPSRRRGAKNNSESSRCSDVEYETMPMSKAAARSVAARGTSVGYDTDIPYAQMDNMSVFINMGDSGPEDHGEESSGGGTVVTKKVTSHDVIAEIGRPLRDSEGAGLGVDLTKYRNIISLPTNRLIPRASLLILQQQQSSTSTTQQQQQQYRTNVKIDIEQGAYNDSLLAASNTAAKVSPGSGVYEQMSLVTGATGQGSTNSVSCVSAGSRSDGGIAVTHGPIFEHVDKSIKLSLEPKCLDPLGNAYVSVKNGRGDQKSEMIIVTPSLVAQSGDRVLTADLEGNNSRPVSQMPQKRSNKHKHERNIITTVSDKIDGFRGKETDLDRLVQFIESKENEQGTGKSQEARKVKNKGGGTNNKKEHGGGGGKLKKSNSMNELRSCSKLDEITSEKDNSGVMLRQKSGKSNKTEKGGDHSKSNSANNSSATTSEPKATAVHSGNKRGDRRSWGTEELQYLGETDVAGGGDSSSFIVDTNNNMSALQQHKKKSAEKKPALSEKLPSAEMSIHTKTLGDLPVNSVSMESLVSSSWANEEFHVVTKKRKSKKKQNIVVQPFEVDRRTTFSQPGSGSGGCNNKVSSRLPNADQWGVGVTASQNRSAKNRPNNLIGSITNATTTTCTSSGGNMGTRTNSSGHGRGSLQTSTATGQRKSRRKSTSSVPPSDHSDCSDLDSVHSLPIESPSTTTSKAAASAATKTPSGKTKGTKNTGSQGVSYADITKTVNSPKVPPGGVIGAGGGIASVAAAAGVIPVPPVTNGLGPEEDRDIKWPSIGKGESAADDISVVKWVNGLSTGSAADERLQKMSDIIKNSQAPQVMRSTEVIGAATTGSDQLLLAGGSGNKTVLQKSKSVDNESSGGGFNMNIDQYPSLEKTVHRKGAAVTTMGTTNGPSSAAAAVGVAGVVSNSTAKEVVTTGTVVASPQIMVNGAAGKKLKLLSSIVSDSVGNNLNNTTVNNHSNATDGSGTTTTAAPVAASLAKSSTTSTTSSSSSSTTNPAEGQPTPVKGSLTSNSSHTHSNVAVVTNGEVAVLESGVGGGEKKMAVKTNNNNNTNQHSSVAQRNHQPLSKGQQQPAVVKANKTTTTQNRTNSMPQVVTTTREQQLQRPAVIILHDERYNALSESDITFGFDVNNQLLFGDFEEDEIQFLEPYPGPSDAVLGRNMDQINTSDYNSYDSSLCSSSSAGGGLATKSNTSGVVDGLVFDNNNTTNDDTAEELDVPPLAIVQPQSTPKQISVTNCSNCTRNINMQTAGMSSTNEAGEGMTLMKNSCVQTSLDNLMMAPELDNGYSKKSVGESTGGAVVVTVSDLESRNVAAMAMKGQSPPDWADAEVDRKNGNETHMNKDVVAATGNGEGFDSIQAKLQQFALINAQFAREAPMGWMCNQMNSFFNNHENVINFVGLAWEDLTHNKSNALKYYNGQ